MTHSLWSWRFRNSAFPVPIWGRHNKTNAEHKEIGVLATEMGLLKLIWWVWTGCFLFARCQSHLHGCLAYSVIFSACSSIKRKDAPSAAGRLDREPRGAVAPKGSTDIPEQQQDVLRFWALHLPDIHTADKTQQGPTLEHTQPRLLLWSTHSHTPSSCSSRVSQRWAAKQNKR